MARSIGTALAAALGARNAPFSIILAGHNGAGKSTLWHEHLADHVQVPLVNADRMMLALLPEPDPAQGLRRWARELRDTNASWMRVARRAVMALVAEAAGTEVSFAMETVFSHWAPQPDGTVRSKVDLIRKLQRSGYFVLLIFVGMANQGLSIVRVRNRVMQGGHAVALDKLVHRFQRTQQAVREALDVADASVLFDNSLSRASAFTPVHVRRRGTVLFNVRQSSNTVPETITAWLDIVAPRR
ncbi:zeta toxin family protein [Cupriavidus respiraculi]|uniref:zeta toxin family protein n=1 Tax=Cupriavidus respiraculi TaxID=195930 RepID=UPI001C94E6E5|nr:zeta toxin family protein [Cupriavidus respiraculi]MBY4946831.1 zeta toxin family protein [Cupriavidus respiraculi]